jgi:hypothetical protein
VLYCISAVTSDPNSDITRCFSTLLERRNFFFYFSWHRRFNTLCTCAVAPLRHRTPFIIERLFFSVLTIALYLRGLRFESRPRYFPLLIDCVIPRNCSESLKQAMVCFSSSSSGLVAK